MGQFEDAAEAKWGWWRNFIKRNPLTGFWSGVVLGSAIGWLLHAIF